VSELAAMKESTTGDGTQTGIAGFLQFKPVFNNRVLNQIFMTWQIWQALPWTQIKDPYLRAAFQFANLKAVLYGQRWSAQEARKLHATLKKNVFKELNVSCFILYLNCNSAS
jgi:hypothetical protein